MQADVVKGPEEEVLSAGRAGGGALVTGVAAIEIVALALWVGGLVALGAIAAPAVFGIVPMPASADAMTLVFRRFDKLAIACSAIALVAEAALAARAGRVGRVDVFRGVSIVLASALAIGQALWLSPAIDALHRAGAIRGLGPAGLALERTHRLAESSGKGQLVLALIGMVLVVVKVARASKAVLGARRPPEPDT